MSLEQLGGMLRRMVAEQTELEKLDEYYNGEQPLNYMDPRIARQLMGRLRPLIVNWPRIIVDSLAERLTVTGFRMGPNEPPDDSLWQMWQANNLDQWSGQAHLDALVLKRSFVSVWYGENDGDQPKISVESPLQMTVSFVPGTSTVASAVKVWQDPSVAGVVPGGGRYANLYLPDRIEKYQAAGPSIGAVGTTDVNLNTFADWEQFDEVPNPLGVVPVVPFPNRRRLTMPLGRSELADVVPIADGINKLATDMMVTSEFHAAPRRWATGIEVPDPTDERYEWLRERLRQEWTDAETGRYLVGGQGVAFGEFAAASLSNFVQGVNLLTAQLAAIAALPPHYLGLSTANPASAEAIRSAEAALVRRAANKTLSFGEDWERVMRLALLVRDGEFPDEARSMETIWADVQTPTPAEAADAAVKLVTSDIIPVEQAQEDLGYSPVQRERMAAWRAAAQANVVGPNASADEIQRRLDMATKLMSERGLSQEAAFRAVGLFEAATQHKLDRAAGATAASSVEVQPAL